MIKYFIMLFLLSLASCVPFAPLQPVDIINRDRSAILQLENENISCTSFNVGNGFIITASHCLNNQTSENITLTDWEGKIHGAYLVYVDTDDDIAVLQTDAFIIKTLDITNEDAKIGDQIITLGFPGYNNTKFGFEVGYVYDFNEYGMISRNMAFPGESGGPIIMVRTNKVVGIAIAMAEKIEVLNDLGVHQHHNLSLILPWQKVQHALDEAYIIASW